MASSAVVAALIIIAFVGFAQISLNFYYPGSNGKLGSMTISGLSGIEAIQFGLTGLLFFAVILLGIFLFGKRFNKDWLSKK